jgi:hypothetical protein
MTINLVMTMTTKSLSLSLPYIACPTVACTTVHHQITVIGLVIVLTIILTINYCPKTKNNTARPRCPSPHPSS